MRTDKHGDAPTSSRAAVIGTRSALAMGLVVLSATLGSCGGGGGSATVPTVKPLAALEPVAEGALVPRVRELLRSRLSARTANPTVSFDRYSTTGVPVAQPTASTTAGAAADTSATPVFSGTTVQEAGVDEADLLKTDGRLLFALDAYTLRDAQGLPKPQISVARAGASASVEPVGTLALDIGGEPAQAKGLLLSDKAARVAALATTFGWSSGTCPEGAVCILPAIGPGGPSDPKVHLHVADVAGTGALTTARRMALDGQLVATRRIGDVMYLVATWSPRLAFEALPATATNLDREAALAALKPEDILPGVRIDGGSRQPLVAQSDCLIQPKATSLSLTVTTLVAVDLASPTLAMKSRCFFGGTEGLYMSPQNLYLATTRSPQPTTSPDGRLIYPTEYITDLHKFSLQGLTMGYRSSGEVKGHLGWDAERISLRMSEHAGDLRVISYTGSNGWVTAADALPAPGSGTSPKQASPATLTILRESTAEAALKAVGALPNERQPAALGKPGEQIYGVRFSGDTGYLVTFRRTDPLYVLDLKDPTDPRTAGELEVPGFSDLLLPLPQGLLLGVGRDADAAGVALGPKVALFDVRDPTKPSLIVSRTFGARGSTSAVDFSSHGLNLLQVGAVARLSLPMSLRKTDWGAEALHVLQRFEVDTAARTLRWRPELAAPSGTDPWDVSADRSVQIADAVYFSSQGRLVGSPW